MHRADTDWGIFAHCAAAERPSLALRNPTPIAHFDEKSGLVQCRTSPSTSCTGVWLAITMLQYYICLGIVLSVILVLGLGLGFGIILYFVIGT